MKRLVAGAAFAVSLTLGAATGVMNQRMAQTASMCGGFGAVKLYLGVGAAYAYRSVRLTSEVRTAFNAGYLFAHAHHVTVPAGDFYQPMAAPQANHVRSLAQDGTVGHGPATPAAAYNVLYTGDIPTQWHTGVNNVVNGTKELMQWAVYDLSTTALPADKAWVDAEDREATSRVVTELDHGVWGVRFNAGFGYSLLDTLAVYCMLTYKIELDKTHSGAAKDVSFATKGATETFRSASNNQNLSSNLVLESFRYNDNNILSDVKVNVKIEETFGIMGGLDWQPSENFGVFANIGAKRYVVNVSYSGGSVAYPGTEAIYTKSFLENNGKVVKLIAQDDVTRKWSSVEWPLTFGAGVRFVFCGRHNAHIGVEYASFEAKLKVARDSKGTRSDDDKSVSVDLSDPHADHEFEAADFKNGLGVHQFAATDVKNTISVAKLEVRDFTLFGGYMLTL